MSGYTTIAAVSGDDNNHLWRVIVTVGLSVMLLGCLAWPVGIVPKTDFNKGDNATWLGVEWVSESHSAGEINALADALDWQQIKHVFVYTSYLKPDGRFNHNHSQSSKFVQGLKAARPNTTVQAWIGLPLTYVDLADATVRDRVVEFCTNLIQEEGFDGIHLDPEPIINDDADVLALLDELRREIGPNATISIATRRIWPVQLGSKLSVLSRFAWQTDYYREIAQRVDQIAVMTYDSGLPLPSLYRRWVSMQVVQLSRAVDGIQVELFIGVPTSEEWTPTHWPSAENMASGLKGVIDGLNDPNALPSAVSGVAIYPHWEMDDGEWVLYESLWLNRRLDSNKSDLSAVADPADQLAPHLRVSKPC